MVNEKTLDDLDFGDWSDSNIRISRKAPICLVLDSSGSMEGEKIAELNKNVNIFIDYIRDNPKASRICDLSVIAFGGKTIDVLSDYDDVANIRFGELVASGETPLGGAVKKAIEMLNRRRSYYRDNAIEHYKPIMLLMSDGNPTDDYQAAARELSEMVLRRELKIFPVGIGVSFNKSVLRKFSPVLEPKIITNPEGFSILFRLLSSSSSNPDDDSLEKWFKDEA